MDVVNFSEGILGIDQNSAPVVAKCLRKVAIHQDLETSLRIISVAHNLEHGDIIGIPDIRQIGEPILAKTQRLFLSL